MREMAAGELLSMAKMLQMETDALALATAIRTAVSDGPLKELVDSGIIAGKARIEELQRFVNENEITTANTAEGGVH